MVRTHALAHSRGEKTKCVDDGCVKGVTQMGSPVVEGAFSGGGGLDGKAEEGDHCEAGVLDLRQLEYGLLLGVCGQAKGVEELAAGVQPPFRVELGVPLELYVPNHKNLNPDQCGYVEWEWEAKVGRPFNQLHLQYVYRTMPHLFKKQKDGDLKKETHFCLLNQTSHS